jgi:hypothetical protein
MLVMRRDRAHLVCGLGVRRIVGMGGVLLRMLVMGTLVVGVFVVDGFRLSGGGSRDRRDGLRFGGLRFARVRVVVLIMAMLLVMIVIMRVIVRLRFVLRMIVIMMRIIMMFGIGLMMFIAVGVNLAILARLVRFKRLGGLRRIGGCAFHDTALYPLAMATATGVAVARTAAVAVGGTVFAFFLGLAMRALIGLDQRLAIGDRDLVVVGMDFAEGQETVAVAAILDEGGLQRGLYAGNFGEVDIAAQLLALGGLEIKLFDAVAADHNDPGLFRVGSVDQHFVGHFGTHDGGGRVWRCAHLARPGDATVHLIRG